MNIKPLTILCTALSLLAPATALADEEQQQPERPDAVRVRGGLNAGGGFAYVSSNAGSAAAPATAFAGRIGVQVNHLFSFYYQNMGAIVISGGTTFFDYNSFMPNLTLGHVVDLGAGPSADVVSVSASNGASATAVIPGMDVRLAFNLGGLKGKEPRRSGLSLGVDVHPSFGPGGVIVTTALGVGYEWF